MSEALAFVAMQSFVTVESSDAQDVATPKSKGKGKTIDVTKFLRVARPPISERTREVRASSQPLLATDAVASKRVSGSTRCFTSCSISIPIRRSLAASLLMAPLGRTPYSHLHTT